MIFKGIEKKENNTAVFTVASDAAEFEAAVNAAYLKSKKDIAIPGFRKGKAPRAVIEGMYGKECFYQDAMDDLAPAAFELGVKESDVKFVGAPAISDVKVEEGAVTYSFAVSLYPEVTLGQYKGLEAEKKAVAVSDEDVEKELQAALKKNARQVSVERAAQLGDTANIDFDGYLDGVRFDGGKGEGYDLVLGSNSFVPGFEEQVVGMSIGEEKDLDITFPEEYVENLAGKQVVFKVKLNSLSVEELPAADDDFAKDVSEFDTLDEYKADLKANVAKRLEDEAEQGFRAEIMKKAVENMTVEVPEVMVSEKAEEIVRNYAANFGMDTRNMELDKILEMMGLDEATMKASIYPAAEGQVKTDLLLDAIVEAEKYEVSDDEAKEYAAKVAEKFEAKVDDIINYFGVEFLKNEKLKEMANAVIFDSAVAVEAKAE